MAINNLSKCILFSCILIQTILASKTVIYWGQNSDGSEGDLRDYCTGTYDVIVIGFVYEFPTVGSSKFPALNFAGHCSTTLDAADPYFLVCPDIASDITYCQGQGVQILLSFGGGVGTYGFSSDAVAQSFATTVWNMFLGGSSDIRPFGSAILDGVDLDIEGGGSAGYIQFIATLRSYFTSQSSRTYYISSAPQCPFPDAMLGPGTGTALQSAWFDYVWVQFYNNYCGLNNYGSGLDADDSQFNFKSWADWAQSTSVNKDVKVFIGAPAGPSAAGSGYVSAAVLQTIHNAVESSYGGAYGGIMLWDTSNSDHNNNFGVTVSTFVHGTTVSPSPSPLPSPTPSASTSSKTSTSGSGRTSTSTSTSTSGRVKPTSTSTSGKKTVVNSQPTIAPTAPVSSPTPATPITPSSGSSSSTDCTLGYMKCLTSETFTTCSPGPNGPNIWSVTQPCPTGLQCSPTGNYIYCIRP